MLCARWAQAPAAEARVVRRTEELRVSAVRIAVIALPAVFGWLLAGHFQLRSVQHLRSVRLADRVAAFLFGPLAGVRFGLEGFRYRALAIASFAAGVALTGLLASLLGQPR